MFWSSKGVPMRFQGGSGGTLMDSPGMGIYIFSKSISVPQYQNYHKPENNENYA